ETSRRGHTRTASACKYSKEFFEAAGYILLRKRVREVPVRHGTSLPNDVHAEIRVLTRTGVQVLQHRRARRAWRFPLKAPLPPEPSWTIWQDSFLRKLCAT